MYIKNRNTANAITNLPSKEDLQSQFQEITRDMSEEDIFDIRKGSTPKGIPSNNATLMKARRVLGQMRLHGHCR